MTPLSNIIDDVIVKNSSIYTIDGILVVFGWLNTIQTCIYNSKIGPNSRLNHFERTKKLISMVKIWSKLKKILKSSGSAQAV